jgi:hypothetical protein
MILKNSSTLVFFSEKTNFYCAHDYFILNLRACVTKLTGSCTQQKNTPFGLCFLSEFQ